MPHRWRTPLWFYRQSRAWLNPMTVAEIAEEQGEKTDKVRRDLYRLERMGRVGRTIEQPGCVARAGTTLWYLAH